MENPVLTALFELGRRVPPGQDSDDIIASLVLEVISLERRLEDLTACASHPVLPFRLLARALLKGDLTALNEATCPKVQKINTSFAKFTGLK